MSSLPLQGLWDYACGWEWSFITKILPYLPQTKHVLELKRKSFKKSFFRIRIVRLGDLYVILKNESEVFISHPFTYVAGIVCLYKATSWKLRALWEARSCSSVSAGDSLALGQQKCEHLHELLTGPGPGPAGGKGWGLVRGASASNFKWKGKRGTRSHI